MIPDECMLMPSEDDNYIYPHSFKENNSRGWMNNFHASLLYTTTIPSEHDCQVPNYRSQNRKKSEGIFSITISSLQADFLFHFFRLILSYMTIYNIEIIKNSTGMRKETSDNHFQSLI